METQAGVPSAADDTLRHHGRRRRRLVLCRARAVSWDQQQQQRQRACHQAREEVDRLHQEKEEDQQAVQCSPS